MGPVSTRTSSFNCCKIMNVSWRKSLKGILVVIVMVAVVVQLIVVAFPGQGSSDGDSRLIRQPIICLV